MMLSTLCCGAAAASSSEPSHRPGSRESPGSGSCKSLHKYTTAHHQGKGKFGSSKPVNDRHHGSAISQSCPQSQLVPNHDAIDTGSEHGH
jgi:hypothetical protein